MELILLFVAIELLPVLVKLMSVTGPESLYEQLAEKRDEDKCSAAGNAVCQNCDVAPRAFCYEQSTEARGSR